MRKDLTKAITKDLGPIVFRNLFSIVTVIIGSLSLILIILGNKRDGLFLGSVITINIIVGIIQEIRAKLSLEKLQLSTKQKYPISRKGKLLNIYAEDILPEDVIDLRLGDQVPVDSTIIEAQGLECNLALLTGESENISKSNGDKLLSGTVVVAGSAKIKASKKERGSYLYRMNSDLKKYQTSYSPIQKAILKFIKIMTMILLILGLIIILRSLLSGESLLSGFVQVAALASTIIAEGLLLASTLLFAYGAIRMARQKVLLQQINAIENLGRMSVVCIDKTGTITENNPVFEKSVSYKDSETKHLDKIMASYVASEKSNTTTFDAIKSKFTMFKAYKISEALSFSSERKYSAIRLEPTGNTIIIGAADKFLSFLSPTEKKWTDQQISNYASESKRIIFVAEGNMKDLKEPSTITRLHVIGLIVLSNQLKPGSVETIKALQKRGVQIVVISGDSPNTVKAIAKQAGVEYGGKIITGDQLQDLKDEDLTRLLEERVLFARTLPEQKQKIVEAIKFGNKNVAMIGDGANDAMAIKSANVGIAMFDGAPATRQIADVVLVNNSFSAIPKGIKLSDTIITTLEMIGCLFFTRVWSGVFLFLITLILKIEYPLYPRNITLLNIFIVTLPILLWLAYPRHRNRSIKDPSYLSRTLPFSIINALIIAVASLSSILVINWLSLNNDQIPMAVFIIFFIMSIYSIGLIPNAIGAEADKIQQRIIYIGYILAALILAVIYMIEPLAKFFSIGRMSFLVLILAVGIGYTGTAIQYGLVKLNFANKLWESIKRD